MIVPDAIASRAAVSIEPFVHTSVAATASDRLPKPLSARPASTASTMSRSCTRQRSSTVTGVGSTISIGKPRSSHDATTCAGFAALGDIERESATIFGV